MAYKYLKEDEGAYHIQHADGSVFRVAKKGLSKDTHAKVQSMKPAKMADGGEVTSYDDDQYGLSSGLQDDIAQNQVQAKADIQAEHPFANMPEVTKVNNPDALVAKPAEPSVADPALSDQSAAVAAINEGTPAPASAAPAALGGPMGAMGAYDKALSQMEQGTQQVANAQSKLATESAKAYADAQEQLHAQEVQRQDLQKGYAAENAALMKGMQDQSIDPNHFMSTRSSAQKIFLGLGMALAAAGGSGDAAATMVNRAIDRDLEAQRLEMGKKQNLLTINMQKTRDLNAATALTKAQMLTALELKTHQLVQTAGSPVAQANAKIALSKIGLMKAQLYQQASVLQQKAQSVGLGGAGGGIPVGQEGFQLLTDPKYTERRVVINGRAYQHAGDGKAANDQRVFESKMSPILSAVDELGKLGKSALIPGTAAHEKAESIRDGLATNIAGLQSTEIGSSKINGEEAERALGQLKNPTKFSQMLNGDIRNDTFVKHLKQTAESVRSQNLLGYKPSQVEFTPGGKK